MMEKAATASNIEVLLSYAVRYASHIGCEFVPNVHWEDFQNAHNSDHWDDVFSEDDGTTHRALIVLVGE